MSVLPGGVRHDLKNAGPIMSLHSLRIDSERLHRNLADLSAIGRLDTGGLNRQAFSPADQFGRKWLLEKAREANLEISTDPAGNMSIFLMGREPELPRVLTGSHLDTVPNGGPLDGALGVLAGLEVLETIKDSGQQPRRTLELVNFSDEEGRFGGLFGSQAFAGSLDLDKLESAQDLGGVKLADLLRENGLELQQASTAARDPDQLYAFVELHIEQGPVLEREELTVGVVDGVAGLFKWKVSFHGQPAHSGTTPMTMRRDALCGVAEFIAQTERVLEEIGNASSVCNVGRIEAFPGVANVVPKQVDFTFEVRETDAQTLGDLSFAFRRCMAAITKRRELSFDIEIISEVVPKRFSGWVVNEVEKATKTLGYSYRRMPSGAIHDSQIVGEVVDSSMIFVPSRDGRSHCPEEFTEPDQIEAGANVLLHTLWSLAR